MPRYLIEFERIGRNCSVAAVTVDADGEADLCRQVRTVARPHIASRDFDVMLDYDEFGAPIAGWLACGMHSGGDFSITAV